jgi:pimeloyl-ACP methyl ester carboxylesterase
MRVEHVPPTQRPAWNNCLPSSPDLNSGGDEFGRAIRWRVERRHRVAGSISWRPPALVALLGILALTAACGTSVKAPSGDGSQPSLVSENKAERVPDAKTYGNLHVTRFIDSEGVFNPTPVAVRARRPGSTTAFVRDTPEPSAAVPGNVAEASPAGPRAPSLAASPDESMTKLVAFDTAPFPYHGAQPGGGPFLNAGSEGRRGHRTARGQILWEDQTFSDNRVLLHIPAGFDPQRPAVMVVFFHGWGATLTRDIVARQKVAAQVSASGANAVLVAPQFAFDARDSSAGRFWEPNGFRRFLNEASKQLAALYGDAGSERAFASAPIVLIAYSGGFLPASHVLRDGGATERVRGLVLLDAAYGGLDTFANWIARNKSGFFLSAYTQYTQGHNAELKNMMASRSVPLNSRLPDELSQGGATFIPTGREASHASYVTHAWDDNPIKIILAKLPEYRLYDYNAVASIDRRRAPGNGDRISALK